MNNGNDTASGSGKATSKQRRRIVLAAAASAVAGGAAMVLRPSGVIIPYPHGSPLVVELSDLPEGKLRTVEWQGKPVWILRRSAKELAALAEQNPLLADPDSQQSLQPPACRNQTRSLRPEILVAIGLCTHQGCTPALLGREGFLCPCHTSKYDLAGRVFKVGPATANLVIPAYHFASENQLLIGLDA
jgi:ubiquinol-cytochrome c reductase iron-sulfur subunit